MLNFVAQMQPTVNLFDAGRLPFKHVAAIILDTLNLNILSAQLWSSKNTQNRLTQLALSPYTDAASFMQQYSLSE